MSTPQNPDSGLIILCQHLAEAGHERAVLSAHYAQKGNEPPEAALDARGGSADQLLGAVVEIPATTLDGVMARVKALAAYAPDELEPWGAGNIGTAHALARAIIRDLVAHASGGHLPGTEQGALDA